MYTSKIQGLGLKKSALSPLLVSASSSFLWRKKNSLDGEVEHFLKSLLGKGRAFHVLDGFDFLSELLSLFGGNWSQALFLQALEFFGVLA